MSRETVHTFAANPFDRGEALRRDEATIAELLSHPGARFLPFFELNVATRDASADDKSAGGAQALHWHSAAELDVDRHSHLVFLGVEQSEGDPIPHFAIALDEQHDQLEFTDCRSVAASLPLPDTGIVAQARAQLDWHRRNPFCAQCGSPMEAERGGQIRRCTACGKHIFPRTDPVAIMLIIDRPGGERCLLGKSQGFMARTNFFSALAGFIDQGESIEDAVRREVREEAGVQVGPVQYHSSQPWPFPSQLMIGCHGVAETQEISIDEEEMAAVEWFPRDEIIAALEERNPELRVPGPMAIAHHLIRAWAHGDVAL